MGDLVEQSLSAAVAAILAPRIDAREQARAMEDRLDTLDTEIEERAHRLLVLQNPMVSDLRLIIATMHICANLEQIGDLSESICKRATYIAKHEVVANPPDLEALGTVVRNLVHGCLAKTVMQQEEESDRLTKRCYEAIQVAMANTPATIREYTHLLRAVSHLEHIGDIAVAIAEETVYAHKGRLIRHHHEDIG
jgi:phosphate transport system protein